MQYIEPVKIFHIREVHESEKLVWNEMKIIKTAGNSFGSVITSNADDMKNTFNLKLIFNDYLITISVTHFSLEIYFNFFQPFLSEFYFNQKIL